MEKLIELTDGAVFNFEQDNWCDNEGCETCGYGSSYITELNISMQNHNVRIKSSAMYEYPLSDGILMRVVLSNYEKIKSMTEIEFYNWLVEELSKECEITTTIAEYNIK